MAEGICPIVSAFSEVKSATGYPKCIGEACSWWTGAACAVTAIADGLSAVKETIEGIATKASVFDDWQVTDGFKKLLGGEGAQNVDFFDILSDLRTITSAVARRVEQKELILGGE